MDLLEKLQEQRGTAIVLITHDLGLVASHADRVMVMYAGRVAEYADTDDVFYHPRHAYSLGLLSSLARLDQRRADRLEPIPGSPPSLIRVPPGCPFHPRCEFATKVCRTVVPALIEQDTPGHLASCHHSDQVAADGRRGRVGAVDRGCRTRDARRRSGESRGGERCRGGAPFGG